MNTDPWYYLGDGFNVRQYSGRGFIVLKELFSSWYSACVAIGIVGLAVSVAIVLIKMMMMHKSSARAELKQVISEKFIAAIILFLLITVFGAIVTAFETFRM